MIAANLHSFRAVNWRRWGKIAINVEAEILFRQSLRAERMCTNTVILYEAFLFLVYYSLYYASTRTTKKIACAISSLYFHWILGECLVQPSSDLANVFFYVLYDFAQARALSSDSRAEWLLVSYRNFADVREMKNDLIRKMSAIVGARLIALV